MRDILFIKTSSLGDVIHQMPAVTDARAHHPDARIGWVVEEAFAPLVRLHPAVDTVIPVALRRWRHGLLSADVWREIGAFRAGLRERACDAVIDTQGLVKSALVARAARGQSHGYDAQSIREPLAARFYDVRHRVSRSDHAIARNRALTAQALRYTPDMPLDYGLDRDRLRDPAGERTAILLHATAQTQKEWPVEHWRTLARELAATTTVLVPWGNERERARALDIARADPRIAVPDRRPLDEVARWIAGASVVVGVDTGLLHLAAALGVPTVAIFGGSDPHLTGPIGTGPMRILGRRGAMPDLDAVRVATGELTSPVR